jgi:hypothetical protein
MKNQQGIEKQASRVAAKRIAAGRGKKWEELTQEERSAEIGAARGQTTEDDRKKAVNMLAKREAKKANLDWKTLEKEERRSLIKRVRSGQ